MLEKGKIFYPEIKEPGGGGNIDHEVPRKDEVQKIKNRWGIKEDAQETSKRHDEKAIQTPTASANSNEDGPDGTGPKGDGTGFIEKENRKEEPKEFFKKRAENEAIYEVICGG